MQGSVLILNHIMEKPAGGGDKFDYEESNVSVLDEVAAVAGALEKLGFDYRVESIKQIRDLPDVLSRSPEKIVFNLIEDLNGSVLDFCYVPAICSAHGKACTGNDTACMLLAQDKWRTKSILRAANLPCPLGVIVPIGEKIYPSGLASGRYIVKPVFSDASEGIDTRSVVDLPSTALHHAIQRIHEQLNQPALVEQFIPDKELNVSVLQRDDKVEVLPIAEIDFTAFGENYPHIVDYTAKWQLNSFTYKHSPRIIPALLSDDVAELVRNIAVDSWRVLGCQDFARVDFRLDDNDNIFVLEVNPNPDISPDAGFAAALGAGGISFEEFVQILLNNALSRLGEKCSISNLKTMSNITQPKLSIRYTCPRDRTRILSILEETKFFRPEELKVAEEVLDEALAKGPESHYQSFAAQDGDNIVGWLCFGLTPCTIGTFDIYWVAVAPEKQRCGVGAYLMEYATNLIKNRKGRMIIVETSGMLRYISTRRFYEKLGYRKATRVKDFYAIGDDKIIYTKCL